MSFAASSLGCPVTKALIPAKLSANALKSVADAYSLSRVTRNRSPTNGTEAAANFPPDAIGGGAGDGGAVAVTTGAGAADAAAVGVATGVGAVVVTCVGATDGAGLVLLPAITGAR